MILSSKEAISFERSSAHRKTLTLYPQYSGLHSWQKSYFIISTQTTLAVVTGSALHSAPKVMQRNEGKKSKIEPERKKMFFFCWFSLRKMCNAESVKVEVCILSFIKMWRKLLPRSRLAALHSESMLADGEYHFAYLSLSEFGKFIAEFQYLRTVLFFFASALPFQHAPLSVPQP